MICDPSPKISKRFDFCICAKEANWNSVEYSVVWAHGAQSEEAPAVACTRYQVPGSDFPPRLTKPSIPPGLSFEEKKFILKCYWKIENIVEVQSRLSDYFS
ncbi:unnamed protein product [Heligmosomoides polygyrus]|uniref:Uncharacterized protein n=1 Tax=Heligmosomoides polygyrus TaxID=6339 RepID=A0A183G1L5_HELPZ|nr:unnamed protein product [Heligmosomoides polygyrus]